MDQQPIKKYNAVRYWRYVFTPIFLVVALFGIYLVFTADPTQTMSAEQLARQISRLGAVPAATATAAMNVPQALGNALNPFAQVASRRT